MDHYDIDYPYDAMGNLKSDNIPYENGMTEKELIHFGIIDDPYDDPANGGIIEGDNPDAPF